MTIYIGNLAYEAENSHLQELVGEMAKVKHVTVVRDRQSGRSKGFAFLNLEDEEEEGKVIEMLQGKDFMGRSMRVIRAHARTLRIP
ncbi:MAG: RNA-binding protein [Bacteroidetes bacterium]|nr:RNA-binding protein [Bacteroidota bacterium]